ncbi:MAG: VWA domain-containing protein, partial [Armatimonadetes bacterium]|nr:VWA domain-containing protein [Armatimonadota bacterium]
MTSRVVSALFGLLLAATASLAQGVIVPERVIVPEPWPVPPHTAPLELRRQTITATIRDSAAVTVVEQSFVNQYNHRLEGTFLFPLPENAAVTDFGMSINGQMVAAELLKADEARRIYEAIVRRQLDPGLLEYVGRNAFRARIFPIEPGETKTVKLEYSQAVEVDGGLGRYLFPLRTRAFHPAPPPVPLPRPMDHRHLERRLGPVPGAPARVGSLAIKVEIDSRQGLKSVYSPSHDIDLKREGEHRVVVGYEAADTVPDEDFQLFYQLSDAAFGLNLLTYRSPADEEGYFMLLLAPKSELREQEVQAKDLLVVFDTSGSMSGEKIVQAREALRFVLDNLNPEDRFNLVTFGTAVDSFRAGLTEVTPEAIKQAQEFVAKLQARGGTNIDEALKTALGMLPAKGERPRMVLFLTDGQPTVGETRPERILENVGRDNKADARMFVFGVGHDVNTVLLDRLSNENHGTRTYVKPEENIETAVSSLYAKIGSPVLSDLRLEVEGVKLSELQPVALPDLFHGSQLTLLGRYRGEGSAKVTLHGMAGSQEQSFEYPADFPREAREHPFLPRLWATRRVGYLLEQIRLHGQDKELVDEVVRLATRHGILTPYTSYLVLEPGMEHPEGA